MCLPIDHHGGMITVTYPDLPITERRQELLSVIRDNQVVVVAGETGSGKSTQLPKLCLELGRGQKGLIGHTQPRRIAARTIAERIAEELGTTLGDLVGYTVRFTDQVGDATRVKVMTDGILLNETHRDRLLSKYDTIIIDEAHERSLNIDFLLGYLKTILPKRPDLKVIITSATIDTERFSEHFGGAPVVEVSGRTYPVEVRYRPLDDPTRDEVRDQPQGICEAVEELFTEGDGDILVFCAGEREIRDAVEAIDELRLPHTEVIPMFGRLSAAEQHRVFQPHTGRRVVVATNVAETSLTVPGIRYVVDCGTARISRFSKRTKVQRLPIEDISRASAAQRAGRCGRLGPGIAIRLYSQDDLDSRPEFTDPEILRTQLASVILRMAALGIGDMETFPFLDPPDGRTIRDGMALLAELQAVDPESLGSGRWVTKIGRSLTRLPVDVRLARMLVEADRNGSLREALIIVAALAIQDPRERPTGEEAKADQLHARFSDERSDFVTWLNLWSHLGSVRRSRSSNQFRKMCREEFLNYRRVREWQDVHSQLVRATEDLGMKRVRNPAPPELIHQALLTGLLSQVGTKDPESYEYRGARGVRFSLSPGSTLFKRGPTWVMAGQLVETGRMWARQVAGITPEEVEAAAEHLVKRSHSDPWWDPEKGAALTNESVSLYGLPLQTTRPVQFGSINAEQARDLLIRHALIVGEWDATHVFVEHNHSIMAEALELERRYQRADLLATDETIVAWFARRIPADITTVRHFDRWWKDERHRQPGLLNLELEDVLDPDVETPNPEDFPDRWLHGDLTLPIVYPAEGGIQIEIPLAVVDRIDPTAFGFLVPGLLPELLDAVLRALPKRIRKGLAPIAESVDSIIAKARVTQSDLSSFLRSEIQGRAGMPVSYDDLRLDELPLRLRPSFRVVDDQGREVVGGIDLGLIKEDLGGRSRARVSATSHPIERSGLTTWDFGELPRELDMGDGVLAYPAIVDEKDSVGIRLMSSRDEQGAVSWDGMRRLMLLNLPVAHKLIRLTNDEKLAIAASPYQGVAPWSDDCLLSSLGSILLDFGSMPFDGPTFDALLAYAKDELDGVLTRTVDVSLVALERYRAVVNRLADMSGRWQAAVDDIEDQLAQLVYSGFINEMTVERIGHIGRYLEAILVRLDGLDGNPERDHRQMDLIQDLESELAAVSSRTGSYGKESELIDIAWAIQELRVSLFAQALGTDGPVSEKRIRSRLEALN